MPRRSRPRIAPTEDREQLSFLIDRTEQLAYELTRPVVLFGHTSEERVQQTGEAERTLRRKAHRFDAHGRASPFTDFREPKHDDLRMLPPPLRQLIVDRKTEYPAFTPHELATLCYVASGRRPSSHTIKRVLATGPKPTSMSRRESGCRWSVSHPTNGHRSGAPERGNRFSRYEPQRGSGSARVVQAACHRA